MTETTTPEPPIRQAVAARALGLLAEQLIDGAHTVTCRDYGRWGWRAEREPGCLTFCRDVRAVLRDAGRLGEGQ